MITQIPPWLDVGPSTYLGAAKAGAATGQAAADALTNYNIHQQQIAAEMANAAASVAQRREEAAGHLALAQAKEHADHELEQAHLALAGNRLTDLNTYRAQENELRRQGLDQREAALALTRGYIHAGNKVLSTTEKNPDGTPKVLYDAGAGALHPLDRMDYESAQKNKRDAAQKLAAGGLSQKDTDFWKGQMDAAEKVLQGIRSKYPGAADALQTGPDLLNQFAAPAIDQSGAGGPAWNTPIPGTGNAWDSLQSPQSLPSMPDSSNVDYGAPDQNASDVRVLNIRPKQ